MDLIGFLLIGLIAGWIATQFMRGSSMGLAGNLVIGVVGAFVWRFSVPPDRFRRRGFDRQAHHATVGAGGAVVTYAWC